MIRAVRTVFEPEGINKHALILCSVKENIGKSYFCEFLCPSFLIRYYNGNPIISNEKDAQKSLIRNFIINLDELHQLTTGKTNDRLPVENLCKHLMGKMFADKGYISKDLFEKLIEKGVELITQIRKNMKNAFLG